MKSYLIKRFFFIFSALILGALPTLSFAGDWEFFDYYVIYGSTKSKDIKVYLNVEETRNNGIISLSVKAVAQDKNSEGCEWLTTQREFCMAWTCTGEYEGTEKTGIRVKEQLKKYIIDCSKMKFSELGTEWYGYDGSSLGRAYWKPSPKEPKGDFPSEEDKDIAQLKMIIDHVCKKYK